MEATATRIVRIRKSNDVRGLTYLPSGHQYTGLLPSGEYRVIGDCLIRYSDLGQSRETTATKVERIVGGDCWYIAPAVAEGLPTILGDYDACPIGSRWKTEAGTIWEVTEKDGEYVIIARLDARSRKTADTYRWHISSLTETLSRRVK